MREKQNIKVLLEKVHPYIQLCEFKNVYAPTDTGNAERFVGKYGRDVRYCHEIGKWLFWCDVKWVFDYSEKVKWFTKLSVEGLGRELRYDDPRYTYEVRKRWARESQSDARKNALLNSTRPALGIPVKPEELDADPMLLNLKNCTINLKTGEQYKHNRKHLITKQCPVNYNPYASSPLWDGTILLYCGGNSELVKFLQRLSGYFLTGHANRREVYFLIGPGGNGKSTFLKVIAAVMGDYQMTADYSTFLQKSNDSGPKNDIARLRGSRLVCAIEAGEGKKLDEVLVKWITGDEKVTARFLYQESFEFTPTFKIVLASNHRPVIKGNDEGIWDRIVMIPFSSTIPKAKRDVHFFDKLMREKEGIMQWMLEGLRDYLKNGLNPPAEIINAVESYRTDMDVEKRFITDNCIVSASAFISLKDLYAAYIAWCDDNGADKLGKIKFNERVQSYGYSKGPKKICGVVKQVWSGLGLKTDSKQISSFSVEKVR